jgi:hypothetical protein
VIESFLARFAAMPASPSSPSSSSASANGPRAVMLSDAMWRSHFASDPAIAGRTITLNENAYTLRLQTGHGGAISLDRDRTTSSL